MPHLKTVTVLKSSVSLIKSCLGEGYYKTNYQNHVSDLQFWRNAARTYNVNSIPATFLIDGDGVT